MIQFPHCKINLGLSIIEKRTDGYHELETLFYPVQLQDMVEVCIAENTNESVLFSHSGIPVPGDTENNLCIKAYQLLKNKFPQIPATQIHLHKHIPMGAGLGGGSSDATAVLKAMNQLFNLQLDQKELVTLAAQLGSDCPFFVYDTPCIAKGRGEILEPTTCDLSKYSIILVHPEIHVSTAWAFGQLNPHKKSKSIASIVQQDILTWKDELINDFEAPIFRAHPLIAQLKEYLYQEGAIYASMSGSGSSLFGIFPKGKTIHAPSFASTIRIDHI
ncbi:MAG: 4-(cytidine 5'-diphospho)-2-C-methyl-D-erythritol kinase [Sediminibacterium sp.]|jgi:4-diphosphocytidyl-2-C-methyl-D-erythritol kinase